MRTLTPAQIAVKSLADEMLKYKRPGSPLPHLDFHPKKIDAAAIEGSLQRASFGAIVLKNGESLSVKHTSEWLPELGLFAGTDQLIDVSLRVIGFDEKDGSWSREIAIQLWYGSLDQVACQDVSITVQTATARLCISRTLMAPRYGEDAMEYEFHNQEYIWADDRQVLEFMTLAHGLFDASAKPKLTTELS